MAPVLPYVMAATSVIGMINRSNANATLNEPELSNQQIAGNVIQDAANRGITLEATSPGVLDAIRRRTLAQRQRRAHQTLQSPDPFSLLPDIVNMFSGGGGSTDQSGVGGFPVGTTYGA